MEAIYRGATYQFDFDVKVNGVVVDVSDDEVIIRIDKKTEVETPLIEKTADVSTGSAKVELTPDETALLIGQSYNLQAIWTPFGTTRKFVVVDESVAVKSII